MLSQKHIGNAIFDLVFMVAVGTNHLALLHVSLIVKKVQHIPHPILFLSLPQGSHHEGLSKIPHYQKHSLEVVQGDWRYQANRMMLHVSR